VQKGIDRDGLNLTRNDEIQKQGKCTLERPLKGLSSFDSNVNNMDGNLLKI